MKKPSDINDLQYNNPTRWNYEAMNAWDAVKREPANLGRTGKGVGIAVIEGPNFNLDHPALINNKNINLIDFGGDNFSEYENGRSAQYHANHVLALIGGIIDEAVGDMDLIIKKDFKSNNYNLYSSYLKSEFYDFKYYGGLAPDANIYAYSRKLGKEETGQCLDTLLKIFNDIEIKNDIKIINLSCRLEVNRSIINQMNKLAEKGIIFVQAVGNDGVELDKKGYEKYAAIQCCEGTSYNDFSSTFWNRHIFVGGLSCYKSESNKAAAEKWNGSSYYTKIDNPYSKNFIMAPGSCILSAGKTGYSFNSGTSMATAFVTSALACALEMPRTAYIPEVLIGDLLSFANKIKLDSYKKEVIVPFLDLKGFIEKDLDHDLAVSNYYNSNNKSYLEICDGDHPTRWVYESMGAWNTHDNTPDTCGYTGKGVGIAVVGSPYFNLDHPSLKNASLQVINTKRSITKENKEQQIEAPAYVGFEPQPILGIFRQPAIKEPVRLPYNYKFLVKREPILNIYEGKRVIPWKHEKNKHWHMNHTLSIISGQLKETHVEMIDLDSYKKIKPCIEKNNPKLCEISYTGNSMRDIYYYGGLAPNANVFIYPRDVDGNMNVLSAILDSVANKKGIDLINLNCQINVNSKIIKQMNDLAEKGKLFIQPIGNKAKDIDIEDNNLDKTIQCVGGANLDEFSATFWDNYIPVGALACYKSIFNEAGVEIWKDSSYSSMIKNDKFKNFILAPGACVLSASYDGYCLDSSTRISASFVTAALACAIEAKKTNENLKYLITELLREKKEIFIPSNNNTLSVPILNIKNLVSYKNQATKKSCGSPAIL